jgi:hypothetical protein
MNKRRCAMKKFILAAAVFTLTMLLPQSQALAGAYLSGPVFSIGVNLGMPVYTEVRVPGQWKRLYGDWVWVEGYWGKRRYEKTYRSLERRGPRVKAYQVPGHWKQRHRDRVWASGHWKKKDRPRYDFMPQKQGKRAGYWKVYRNNKNLW